MNDVSQFLPKCWQCLTINAPCAHSGQHCPLGDPSLAAVMWDVGFWEVLQCVEEGQGDVPPLPILGCPHGSSPANATCQEVTGLGGPSTSIILLGQRWCRSTRMLHPVW